MRKSPPRTFIPKQDQRLPDGWGIIVTYLDGSHQSEFEGTHRFINIEGEKWLEIVSIDDKVVLITKEIIKSVELDGRFFKTLETKRKMEQETQKK